MTYKAEGDLQIGNTMKQVTEQAAGCRSSRRGQGPGRNLKLPFVILLTTVCDDFCFLLQR